MRCWSHQIVTLRFGKFEEYLCYDATNRVRPSVVVIGIAATVTIPACERIGGARLEFSAEYID